ETPDQERGRKGQGGEGGEQQRERGAVLVEIEVLVGVGGVQVAVREQVHRRGAEHLEVVGRTQDAALHRDERGAREVQGEDEALGATEHGGRRELKPPGEPRKRSGGVVAGGDAPAGGGGGPARGQRPPWGGVAR